MYARDAGGGELAVVAMNKAWSPRVVDVPIGAVSGLSGLTLADVAHEERVVEVSNGVIPLSLGPWEYAILLPE